MGTLAVDTNGEEFPPPLLGGGGVGVGGDGVVLSLGLVQAKVINVAMIANLTHFMV